MTDPRHSISGPAGASVDAHESGATEPADDVLRDDEDDRQWNLRVRGESRTEQLDRNFATLLQELRVVQTGVQVLTGILLTLPFQSRFPELSTAMQVDYLLVAAASIAATVFLTAPVAAHRMLFRRHRLEHIVRSAHRCAVTGILFLGLALTGVAVLIFDFVAGPVAAAIAGVAAALMFVLLWFAFPYRQRAQNTGAEEQGPPWDPRARRSLRGP